MHIYCTDGYESKEGQSLDDFAEHIADHHAECGRGEPQVEYLSLLQESETAITGKGLEQFREKVQEHFERLALAYKECEEEYYSLRSSHYR